MGLRGICEALARLSGSVKRRRWQRILCATMAGVLACLAAPSSGRAGGCMAFGGRCVPCGKGAIVTVGRRGRRGGLRLGRGPCLRCLVKAGSTADCIGSHSPAVTQPAISLVLRVEKPGTGTRFRAICLNMLQGVGKSGAGGSLSDPAWIARFCMGKTCCDLVTLSAFARIDFPRRSKAAQRPDCPTARPIVRSSDPLAVRSFFCPSDRRPRRRALCARGRCRRRAHRGLPGTESFQASTLLSVQRARPRARCRMR